MAQTPPKRQKQKLSFSLAVTGYARVRVNRYEKQRVHARCFSRIIGHPVDF
jgi:Tfp pilus assembly pilus retraction ATPase PilT